MNHEAERLENRIDMVTNETLDATRRIRQVAEETNQIGIDTLVTLNEQGEQLDNIEVKVDNIGADLRGTEICEMYQFGIVSCFPSQIPIPCGRAVIILFNKS